MTDYRYHFQTMRFLAFLLLVLWAVQFYITNRYRDLNQELLNSALNMRVALEQCRGQR